MGLAAAYIEYAADTATTSSILAAHTSEEDEPEEENHNERGEDVEQYIPSAARLLVANVGFELAVFGLAPPFDVFGKLVGRGYVSLDGELAVFGLGLIISLLDALKVFGFGCLLETCNADARLGVDDERTEVALLCHTTEVRIAYLARRFATREEIDTEEDANDDEVNPVEIEPTTHTLASTGAWRLGAGFFALWSWFLVYVFFVCHGFNE